MIGARILFGTSRLLLAAVGAVSAMYCVLTYVPFTNQNLIQSHLLEWLGTFVSLQPWLMIAVMAFATYTLSERVTPDVSRLSFVVPAALLSAFGVALVIMNPLRLAGMQEWSVWLGVAQFLPVLIVAVADLAYARGRLRLPAVRTDDDGGLLVSLAVTAAIVFATLFFVGVVRAPANLLTPGDREYIALVGFSSQLIIAMMLLVVYLTIRAADSLVPKSIVVEIVATMLIAAAAVAWMLYTVVLRPISFDGTSALIFAAAFAIAIVAAISGNAARTLARDGSTAESGPDFAFTGLGIPAAGSLLELWIAVVITMIAAALAIVRLSMYDWDFLLQKLVAIAFWVIVAGLTFRISGFSSVRNRWLPGLAVSVVVLGFYAALVHGAQWTSRVFSPAPAQAMNAWRGYDVAFRLANDAFSRASRNTGRDEFYDFLSANTNISRAVKTPPVDVKLVDPLTPSTGGRKPDIFMIVIDSLRRDYVGAYNSNVTFTPRIDELATDATVFRNSFSHYGATGLAEPSMWVGGLMLHKQYIEPFYPMNSLQKLLETEQYRMILAYDPVLDAIVKPGPYVMRMAQHGTNQDLCDALEELKQRVSALADDGRPTFAYLQPLNIHISSINREGPRIPAGESYPGFHAPTAWRLRRIDGCIGGFVDFLKARNQYESSIIVITSDHGDVLGEQGLWGHAYTITPSVIRVPLIVKLPEEEKTKLVTDPAAIAFNSDIAPTMYYLLGHRAIKPTALFGRPLFTQSLEEQKPFLKKRRYLIASSYGPVYGALNSDGRKLFIADAVNFRDSVYDMIPGSQPVERAPDAREIEAGRELIYSTVREIAGYYQFTPER